jgi:hypothetical protein
MANEQRRGPATARGDATEDWFVIEPPKPPDDGVLFVDHAKTRRSGHLGHALVEYGPGKILAFYANCSDFNLECRGKGWKPLAVPTYLRSTDCGFDWEPAKPMGDQPGRIWDVMSYGGCIFALELCNDSEVTWYGSLPEHYYGLYVSLDHGHTFSRRSVLPFDIEGRGYGTMAILSDGSLIVYVYNIEDEKNLDYVTSQDDGCTWSEVRTAFMAKQIRNPQMAVFKGGYVLHGRSGNKGVGKGHFVLYTSRDGVSWDAGRYLRQADAGWGAYSNNLLVSSTDVDTERLLIQASHAYEEDMTNVLHWWLS